MNTMAEDNARDMRALRKIRDAHEALRIVLDDAGCYVKLKRPAEVRSTFHRLQEAAEHIEAVWN